MVWQIHEILKHQLVMKIKISFLFLMIFFFKAWYEERECDFTIVQKYQGSLFQSQQVNKIKCFFSK
jgi:hypothetical protein